MCAAVVNQGEIEASMATKQISALCEDDIPGASLSGRSASSTLTGYTWLLQPMDGKLELTEVHE